MAVSRIKTSSVLQGFPKSRSLLTGNTAYNPFTQAIALATFGTGASPYVYAYPWSDSLGFGTKYSNPSTAIPDNGRSLKFNNASSRVAVGFQASPYTFTNFQLLLVLVQKLQILLHYQ